MATNSKYKDQQVNAMLNDIISVFEKHQAPTDLSLMVLGDLVTNILVSNFSSEQQQVMAQAFTNALNRSLQSTTVHSKH